MEILYVAHCVPWPPDKGDRIRGFHTLSRLVEHHKVHLACLARNAGDASAPSELRNRLASVRIEVLDIPRAIARGFLGFLLGGSFTSAFHLSPALKTHIRTVLANRPIGAVVILSSSMAAYASTDIPFLADWGDVDSEKRLQYAQVRFPGIAHRVEAHRMRKDEREGAMRARQTFLTTRSELELFTLIAPQAPASISGNGVDANYFDPSLPYGTSLRLAGRKNLVFVGMLDYFPNADGVRWFAENVFSKLRKRDPDFGLILVGRNPTDDVVRLGKHDGVTVTGAVDDVRPYLSAASAVIAPLRIARGIQNKVLEALAMGKQVLASEAVCRTFLPELPAGVRCCRTADDYLDAIACLPASSAPDMHVAEAARERFSWSSCLDPIVRELAAIERDADILHTQTRELEQTTGRVSQQVPASDRSVLAEPGRFGTGA